MACLVLLDLSAAFDTIDHNILLGCHKSWFGLGGTIQKWFVSYFSNHCQTIKIGSTLSKLIYLFIYLGFYVAFNTKQVISRQVVGSAEETSTYSWSMFCTVNCRPMASNYQLSRPQRWEARVLPLCHHGPLSELSKLIYGVHQDSVLGPLSFSLETKSLSKIISLHPDIKFHFYANDTR